MAANRIGPPTTGSIPVPPSDVTNRPAPETTTADPTPTSGANVTDTIETNSSNAPRDLIDPKATTAPTSAAFATTAGKVTTPALVVNPIEVFSQLKDGELTVAVPMVPGRLGFASIKPNTFAHLNIVVKDGKVDFKQTELTFKDENGEDSFIDGPWIWDAEKAYIDDEGRIKAQIRCFPNPNITPYILGKEHNKLSGDVGDLLKAFQDRAQKPLDITVAPSVTIGGAQPDSPIPTTTVDHPTEEASTDETINAGPQLSNFIDLKNLKVDYKGSFKAGPLRFGKGATLVLAEGNEVQTSGTLSDLVVNVKSPIKSMELKAEGTQITTRSGNLDFQVLMKKDGEEAPSDIELRINEFELNQLAFETPAEKGEHNITIGEIAIRDREDNTPLIYFKGAADDTPSQLVVHLPEVNLNDVAASIEVKGTDGNLTTFGIGRGGDASAPPVNFKGSLGVDSQAGTFDFKSRTDNLLATIGRVSLVDGSEFDLELDSATLRGSGKVNFSKSPEDTMLCLSAEDGKDWEIDVQLHDAHIGTKSANPKVVADLSSETGGTLQLDRLDFHTNSHPEFSGRAQFAVGLDELKLPLSGDQSFLIKEGSVGTLIINQMDWEKDATSPAVDAELRISIGANAELEPGDIPGVNGARIELDVQSGEAILIIKAKLTSDGKLTTDCGLNLNDVAVRTKLSRGDIEQLPDVQLNPNPIVLSEPTPLAIMRTPIPHDAPITLGSVEELGPPKLPAVQIRPTEFLSSLKSTALGLNIPIDRLDDLRLVDYDTVHEEEGTFFNDTTGTKVTVDINRRAGDIRARLVTRDGKIVPSSSKFTVDPPMNLEAELEYFLPVVSGSVGTSVTATVSGLDIRKDDDGNAYLWPEVELSGLIPGAAEALGLEDKLKGLIGNQIAQGIFGTSSLPLETSELLGLLEDKIPSLKDGITIEPEIPDWREREATGTTGSTGSTSTSSESANATEDSALVGLKELMSKVRLTEASLNVQDAQFDAGILDLGNDQSIEFLSGTKLNVSGGLDNLTITGHASLGQLRLGGNELNANLQGGEADIAIHVKKAEDGSHRITVSIDNLVADDLAVGAQTPSGHLNLSDISVGDGPSGAGQIYLAMGGGQAPDFVVKLPDATASIEASGQTAALGHSAGADTIKGHLAGSFEFADGKLSGEFTNIDLKASGVDHAQSGASRNETAGLSLVGAARLETGDDGTFHLYAKEPDPNAPSSQRLSLNTHLGLNNGSAFSITNGHAEHVALGFSDSLVVELNGLSADNVNALLPITKEGAATKTVVDLRTASIHSPDKNSGIRYSAAGFETVGNLAITNANGSVSNVGGVTSEAGKVDIAQLDFEGNGFLHMETDGTVGLRSAEKDGFKAKAITRDLSFTTVSPEMVIDMDKNGYLEASLGQLIYSPDGSMAVELDHGRFEGLVEKGNVTVGAPGSPLEILVLEKGAKVMADIPSIAFASGRFATDGRDNNFAVDGQLNIEGQLRDYLTELPSIKHDHANFHIERASIKKDVRLALAFKFRDESFATNSHAQLNGRINVTGSGFLDAGSELDSRLAESGNN